MLQFAKTTGTSNGQRLFPLHLTPIERFMLADDRPEYPMTFVLRLEFSGRIDRGAFDESLTEALCRHPLLCVLLKPAKRSISCWVSAPDHRPALDWAEEGTPLRCPRGERIDLSEEVGLRIWVRQGPDRATVTLQFHHAPCDGTGAYRFIGDLLAAYGIYMAADERLPSFSPVDASLLRFRKQRISNLGPGNIGGPTKRALKDAWQIVVRRPAPLVGPKDALPSAARSTACPEFLCHSFDRAEHQQLRGAAGRQGVTLNDLLLCHWFLAMAQWNRQQHSRPRRQLLRIMMPTDLRNGDDYEMPAANITSYSFLSRRLGDSGSVEELLRSVSHETLSIKHLRPGFAFANSVALACAVPGLLPFLLGRNLCLATAVLSNTADPSRRFTATMPRVSGRIACGNLVLEEITGVPPLRPNTRASIGISQYDRRLTICLRCDPYYFDRAQTRRLLTLYVDQLRRSL